MNVSHAEATLYIEKRYIRMSKIYAALALLFVVLTVIDYLFKTQSVTLHPILKACITAVLAYVFFGIL